MVTEEDVRKARNKLRFYNFMLLMILFVILFGFYYIFTSVNPITAPTVLSADTNENKHIGSIDTVKYAQLGTDEQQIITECQNLDREETSVCFLNHVKIFFKYNPTDDDLHLSIAEIKVQGGDCQTYAELYESLGDTLGFYTSTPTININKEVVHLFAVISDDSGYCILDQTAIKCVNLGKV